MLQLDLASIEEFVSRHGHFSILDWLIETGAINYSDYESWRLGKLAVLADAIVCDHSELKEVAQKSRDICDRLGLEHQAKVYYGWDSLLDKQLVLSNNDALAKSLGLNWQSPPDRSQMDLFFDNAIAVTENQLVDAIGNRYLDEAEKLLQKLTELNPSHPSLGAYLDLINYGWHQVRVNRIERDEFGAELEGLENEVMPLAKEYLGSHKRDYISSAWRRLAVAIAGQPFDPQSPSHHLSYPLMQIPDWKGLVESLQSNDEIAYPELMARLAMGYHQLGRVGESLLTWARLSDRHAERAEDEIERSAQKNLLAFWDDFLSFDQLDLPSAAFGGFLVLKVPGISQLFERFDVTTLNQEYNQLCLELARARAAGHDETQLRKQLSTSCRDLLKLYLMTSEQARQ